MSRFIISRGATALALAATIATSAGACTARDGTAGGGAPSTTHVTAAGAATSEAQRQTIAGLLADARAAATRHDARTLHQIRARLASVLRRDTVRQVVADHRQVLANLAAANARHDLTARARYRAQLRGLCDPAGVVSALGLCGADLDGHGD